MDAHDLKAAFGAAGRAGRRAGRKAVEKAVDGAKDVAAEVGVDVEGAERRSRDAIAAVADKSAAVGERMKASGQADRVAATNARIGKSLAKAPVLSLASDSIQSRHDLRHVVDRLKTEPDSLNNLLWAANALRDAEVSLQRYRRFRATKAAVGVVQGNPMSALVQLSVRMTGQLSDGGDPPPVETLLRSAFAISVARLRQNPGDSGAYATLARVYLLQEQPEHAVVPAMAAVRTASDPIERGDAYTSLAYAYQGIGDLELAERAATKAIDAGVSTGHLVLATLAEADDEGALLDRTKRSADHRRSAAQHDVERYFGPKPSGGALAREVWGRQREKTATLAGKVSDGVKKVGAELTSTAPPKDPSAPEGWAPPASWPPPPGPPSSQGEHDV